MNKENPVSIWKLAVRTIHQLKRLHMNTYYEPTLINKYDVPSDAPMLIVTYSTKRRNKRRSRRHVNDVMEHACPLTEK